MINRLEKFFLFLSIVIVEYMVSEILVFSQLPTDEKIVIDLTMYGCLIISLLNLFQFIKEIILRRKK